MNSSTALKRRRIPNLIARIGLLTLIVILGTMVVPVMQTKGLTPTDLSDGSVRAVATSTGSDVLYA